MVINMENERKQFYEVYVDYNIDYVSIGVCRMGYKHQAEFEHKFSIVGLLLRKSWEERVRTAIKRKQKECERRNKDIDDLEELKRKLER